MPPKTIDNLGPEAYSRYAQDQEELSKLELSIKEGRAIPPQTEVDVTVPTYPSEFDLFTEAARRNIFWADFYPPSKYHEQKKRLFTYQIIPSLGSADKQETQTQRITDTVAATRKRKEMAEEEMKAGKKVSAWEEEKELEAEQREKDTLLNLFKRVASLEKDLIDINSRRGQYHKG